MSANVDKILKHKTDRLARKYIKWVDKRSIKDKPKVDHVLAAAKSVVEQHQLRRLLNQQPKYQRRPGHQPL